MTDGSPSDECFPAGDPQTACFRAADGTLIVEVDLRLGKAAGLPRIVELARRSGAGAIWAHANAIDADLGFKQRGGYARLEAERPPPPADSAQPPRRQVWPLQLACFAGVWGHPEPDEQPDPDALFVGLYEAGAWVGVCAVDIDERWIDGPGLLPGFRTPDRYARLVRGAATLVGSGSVTLESWGDSEETLAAYRQLGFVSLEYVQGWELLV